MGFYANRVLPPIIDRVLSTGHIKKHRSHVVPGASGTVVELGFGTGTNLEFYDPEAVTEVLAVDPATGARNRGGPHQRLCTARALGGPRRRAPPIGGRVGGHGGRGVHAVHHPGC